MEKSVDPRRKEKVNRYKPREADANNNPQAEDPMPDYMNILAIVFSMCGLMMKSKWCSWAALYCSCVSFANSRKADDAKQILSSFMLSISSVVMSYLQNPTPLTPPWASST